MYHNRNIEESESNLLARVAVVSRVARDPAATDTGTVAPVVRVVVLGAPGPHDPASATLVRAALSVKRATELVLVLIAPVLRVTRLAAAGSVVLAARELAIQTRTLEAAIHTRSTVGECRRPLTNDLVQVLSRLLKAIAETAPVADTLGESLRNRVVVEDRVDVSVHHHILEARRVHLVVPVVGSGRVLEGIANDNHKRRGHTVSGVADGVVGTLVKVVDLVAVTVRLVHERNTRHSRVLVLAEFLRELTKEVNSAALVSVIAEPVSLVETATVVVAIGTTRDGVHLNNHGNVVLLRPACSLLELIVLVELQVRITRVRAETPVGERNTDVVETVRLDLAEVILSDKVVEVVTQNALRLAARSVLGERPLVNDTVITSLVVDTRGNERLNHKPTADTNTADLLTAVVEAERGRRSTSLESETRSSRFLGRSLRALAITASTAAKSATTTRLYIAKALFCPPLDLYFSLGNNKYAMCSIQGACAWTCDADAGATDRILQSTWALRNLCTPNFLLR